MTKTSKIVEKVVIFLIFEYDPRTVAEYDFVDILIVSSYFTFTHYKSHLRRFWEKICFFEDIINFFHDFIRKCMYYWVKWFKRVPELDQYKSFSPFSEMFCEEYSGVHKNLQNNSYFLVHFETLPWIENNFIQKYTYFLVYFLFYRKNIKIWSFCVVHGISILPLQQVSGDI